MQQSNPPKVLSVETAYQGKLFDVHIATLRMPDGAEVTRETLIHPGAVCAVPVGDDGKIYFVTQYRHAAHSRILELPAGTLEPGEEPKEAMLRELQEEIGMLPGEVEPLGGVYVAPGYKSEYIHLFLCRVLSPSRLPPDRDEDLEVTTLSLTEALAAVEDGRINDAKTLIGVLAWARRAGGDG